MSNIVVKDGKGKRIGYVDQFPSNQGKDSGKPWAHYVDDDGGDNALGLFKTVKLAIAAVKDKARGVAGGLTVSEEISIFLEDLLESRDDDFAGAEGDLLQKIRDGEKENGIPFSLSPGEKKILGEVVRRLSREGFAADPDFRSFKEWTERAR